MVTLNNTEIHILPLDLKKRLLYLTLDCSHCLLIHFFISLKTLRPDIQPPSSFIMKVNEDDDQEEPLTSQIQGRDMQQGASYQLLVATRLRTSVFTMQPQSSPKQSSRRELLGSPSSQKLWRIKEGVIKGAIWVNNLSKISWLPQTPLTFYMQMLHS